MMDPRSQYRAAATETAGPAQLVLMLYDGALARIASAEEQLAQPRPDLLEVNRLLQRAQRIVTELLVTLDTDRGGAIAEQLADLYGYCNRELIEANLRKDAEPLASVREVLTGLRDAWDQACVSPSGSDVEALAG